MDKIKKEIKDNILYIDFNSPPVNVLEISRLKELTDILQNEKNFKVVALKGSGKIFCAGLDVKDHLPDKVQEMLDVFSKFILQIFEYPGLVVSVVQGGAYGGGCEVALCCDIVLAEKDAVFSQPEIKLGVFPPVACALYPLLFPSKFSNLIIYSGENFKAGELEKRGIITKTFDKENLFEESHNFLKKFNDLSFPVLKLTKKATNFDSGLLKNRLDRANKIYLDELMKTEDALEGLKAFLEKRKPVWKEK